MGKSLVEPGDPAASHLLDRLLARDAPIMPPFGGPLEGEALAAIECWIVQGAPEGTAVEAEPEPGVDAGEGDAADGGDVTDGDGVEPRADGEDDAN